MFQSLDLLALSCLFLSVESKTGEVLQPQNVSLSWKSDFEPQLTWAPPEHSVDTCTYDVFLKIKTKTSERLIPNPKAPWFTYVVMEGGFLQVSLETKCGDKAGLSVVLNQTNPVLVRNLNCYIYSSKKSHCSWIPDNNTTDLSFFYRLLAEDLTADADNDTLSPLKECCLYTYTGGVRTGCNLEADIDDGIHILFNGTVKNMPVWNTFKRNLIENVKPSALNWTVTKSGNKFIISWLAPDFGKLDMWTFIINYTECDETKVKTVEETLSFHMDLLSHCPYRMAIKAKAKMIAAETPWSDEKYFGADTDPYALVYAAIIIPLMFAALAALTLICCRKNKETIFPKVPEPRDLLSDISDNNNKSNVCNLYIPAVEEDNCKITLVLDPHNKLI